MRLSRLDTTPRRAGVAAVEMAVVAPILILILFGIFEYCRFLFLLHVANNSAREAARYAAVRTNGGLMPDEPATITQSDLIQLVTTGQVGTQTIGPGMSGMQHNVEGWNAEVFFVDPVGLAQTTPIARVNPQRGSAWNTTGFGQKIAVRITGTYRPILPSIFFLPSGIPFQITAMASSEAN